jgi:exosortase
VREDLNSRSLLFFIFCVLTLIAFYQHLVSLFVRSFHDEVNDYILIVPLVSLFFIYSNRKEIFSTQKYSFQLGVGIIGLGVLCYLLGLGQKANLNENDYLSILTFSSVIIWIGGFVLFYGLQAFRKALFPLLFLLFMVPIPTFFLQKLISVLQEGSAEVAFILFRLSGTPVLREGFIFHLPNLSIEVAEQCSGIHSGIALFITSIIAGKLFLATAWKKGILILSFLPITIMKNGLRIVTLSLLGNNIDERILSSPLHREGGIPFFVLAVSFLLIVLWLLRRSEKRWDLRSA